MYSFTRHAVERILEMGVEPGLVRDCLYRPQNRADSVKYPNQVNHWYGDLCLKIDATTGQVVTAVWSNARAWRDDLVGRGGNSDRKLRGGKDEVHV